MTSRRRQQYGRWLISAIASGRISRALKLIERDADLTVKHGKEGPALYTAIAHDRFE